MVPCYRIQATAGTAVGGGLLGFSQLLNNSPKLLWQRERRACILCILDW
jgi:hypothetical protein